MKDNLTELLGQLSFIEEETDWLKVAEECSMEKQIEIRAEIGRTIKRIEKELAK